MKIFLVALVLVTTAINANAQTTQRAIFPENDLHLDKTTRMSRITKEVFDKLLITVMHQYRRLTVTSNLSLSISGDWENEKVNAYAAQRMHVDNGNGRRTKVARITILGGIARHPDITLDALALVVCHEVGHVLGGAPYIKGRDVRVSSEGQSDFYAARYCMEKLVDKLPASAAPVSGMAQFVCEGRWFDNPNMNNKCKRIAAAGEALAGLLAKISRVATPEIDTPDMTVVGETLYNSYPSAQCRLDTYVAGATWQPRPACWYAGD